MLVDGTRGQDWYVWLICFFQIKHAIYKESNDQNNQKAK